MRETSRLSGEPAKPIRVRFAPSPTGFLHVGGARTAIFNWLFARRHQGVFVLRIEDTDVERSTGKSERSLMHDLRWLGLDWDEGPDIGGPATPYRQSERLDAYRDGAQMLVDSGRAYPCFCSDELLEAKRRDALQRGAAPQYDGTCRALSADEVAARRKQKIPEALRFSVPEDVVRFNDLVRKEITLAADTVGDFVLVRSNGRPTYNFAAVLDDNAMKITHVLRGEEHLPNTLRQILLYKAFEYEPPEFGHLPLILAKDRSKLSKRHDASSVGELRERGFLPTALVNYLVLLGWSHPEGKELLSVDELIDNFSLDRVNKAAAVFDRQKLLWMDGQYIRRASVDDLFVTADDYFPEEIRATYPAHTRKEILRLLQDGLECLAQLSEAALPFRSPPDLDDEARTWLTSKTSADVLATLRELVKSAPSDFSAADFKSMIKDVGARTSTKGKDLFFPVRAALTGAVHGPDLAGVAAIRGKSDVLELIERSMGRNR